jgi:hypothetical protein
MTKAPKRRAGKTIDLILEYFSDTCSDDRSRELRTILWNTIVDPTQLESSGRLSFDSRARTEARVVSDSLESVTNGMFNPEALEGLHALDETSIFYPWKHLVLALSAIYSGSEDMQACIDRIPQGTPPERLKPVLCRIAQLDTATRLSSQEEVHSQRVLRSSDSIGEALDGLAACVAGGNEDAFADGAALAVKDILAVDSELALQVAAWAFAKAFDLDLSVAVLVKRLGLVLPPSEVQRLLALALLPEAPEISLLAWIRSLRLYIGHGDAEPLEVRERLRLIGEIAPLARDALETTDLPADRDYMVSLEALSCQMLSEMKHAVSGMEFPAQSEDDVFDLLVSFADSDGVPRDSQSRPPAGICPPDPPVQFELF